ncbi:MAG: alpha/beta hydrolase family protein [Actinomycetes bacterium]
MRLGNVHRPGRGPFSRLAVLAVAVVMTACAAPAPGPAPTEGPGTDGPCGVRRTNLPNPADWRHDVALFEPTGAGSPWTGGTCGDDARPVALLAHGYGGSAPEVYQGLVDHLVGNGFLVVFPPYDAEFDPPAQYRTVEVGLGAAIASTRRADTERFGVVGHSFGGGMSPHLVQVVNGRGWGGRALWTVMFAPWFAFDVGTAQIDVPARTRVRSSPTTRTGSWTSASGSTSSARSPSLPTRRRT